MRIYLAGGMKSDWRKDLMRLVSSGSGAMWNPDHGIHWLDPRKHKQLDYRAFVDLDLRMIDNADVVVAHIDPENPSGLGTSAEIGYAKAMNKTVIYVPSYQGRKGSRGRKYGETFLIGCADIISNTLEDAASVIQFMVKEDIK
jgi:nucleoside 2-deoxyribosyltransferase